MTHPGDERQGEKSSPTRQFYRSSNGDAWLLVKSEAEVVVVEHRPNAASGGEQVQMDIGAFLSISNDRPERTELMKLIATLIELANAGEGTS